MRKNILKYFEAIDNWLYLILAFCFLGLIRNFLMLRYFEFNYTYFATKVCLAMFVIYFAQIALILMRQRIVFVISLIQVLFCAFVFRDFTFLDEIAYQSFTAHVLDYFTRSIKRSLRFSCAGVKEIFKNLT